MKITTALAALAVLVATAQAARADDGDYDDATYHHMVRAGGRLQIANARSWGPAPECRSTGATIVYTERPAHGGLTVDHVTTTVPAERENCGGTPVATTRVFYMPVRGYQGPEHIGMDLIYGNGGRRHVDQDIEVLPAPTHVAPGQVLAVVPPPGTLDVPTGTAVLINDHTCPPGQIKQMIAGSMNPPIARTFSCIRR